jgi:hypothetical protein
MGLKVFFFICRHLLSTVDAWSGQGSCVCSGQVAAACPAGSGWQSHWSLAAAAIIGSELVAVMLWLSC